MQRLRLRKVYELQPLYSPQPADWTQLLLIISRLGHWRPQSLPPIINAQSISKAFGAKPLFQDVSFTISEGDRIGLIGPNGSGKSTLLRILAGMEEPDNGDLSIRKRVRNVYVEQDSRFKPGDTVRSVVERALQRSATNGSEPSKQFETLGRA